MELIDEPFNMPNASCPCPWYCKSIYDLTYPERIMFKIISQDKNEMPWKETRKNINIPFKEKRLALQSSWFVILIIQERNLVDQGQVLLSGLPLSQNDQ